MDAGAAWVQLLPFVLLSIVVLIPSIRLLRRIGVPVAFAIFAVIPPVLGPIIILYIVAYSKWPAIVEGEPQRPRGRP
jgi:hypothetical protein